MSDTTVLGQRRAAQRLGAAVLEALKDAAFEPPEDLVADQLTCKLDELAYEAGVEVLLEAELHVTLAVGSPMGLTVREIEPDKFLLVTGVEPGSQGCRCGVRIGYFVRAINGEEVNSLEEVFGHLKAFKAGGVESFELALTAGPPTKDAPIDELEDVTRGQGLSQSRPAAPTPVVIAGPSGVGKGTLIGKLLQAFPGAFGFSVSHTTRAPRPGEVDGKDYHFTTLPLMEAAIARGEFLEHAKVHGNYYGTSFAAVKDVAGAGKICLLDIDIQVRVRALLSYAATSWHCAVRARVHGCVRAARASRPF
jgi:hypothetical protein